MDAASAQALCSAHMCKHLSLRQLRGCAEHTVQAMLGPSWLPQRDQGGCQPPVLLHEKHTLGAPPLGAASRAFQGRSRPWAAPSHMAALEPAARRSAALAPAAQTLWYLFSTIEHTKQMTTAAAEGRCHFTSYMMWRLNLRAVLALLPVFWPFTGRPSWCRRPLQQSVNEWQRQTETGWV